MASTGDPIQLYDEYPELRSEVPTKYGPKLQKNYSQWTAAETEEVMDYANKLNARASQVAGEISILKNKIRELQLRNARMQKIKAPYKALASAARRLPDPVLQSIFIHCLPATRNAVMDESESPLLLGRVCRRWHALVYSTPDLWARLHIVPPHITHTNMKRCERQWVWKRDVVRAWLDRSGDRPLSISYVWFADAFDDAIRLNGLLLEALVPFSERWKDLDIQAPMVLLKPLYALPTSATPLLTKISFMGNRSIGPIDVETSPPVPEPGMDDAISFVGRSLQLRELSLANNVACTLPFTSIAWGQLKALFLESNTLFFFRDFGEMLRVLGECRSLRSLSLKYPINRIEELPGFDYSGPPAVLPNLELLCIDGDQHVDNTFGMSHTLSYLIAPRLQELSVMGRTPRDSNNPSCLVLEGVKTLVEASQCPITRLKLETVNLRASGTFLEVLALCPLVEELVAYNFFSPHSPDGEVPQPKSWSDDELLRLMTPSVDGTGLCPRLRTFDYALNGIDDAVFRTFVESRSVNRPEGVRQLKSLRASLTVKETKEAKEWADRIKAQGTELSLMYHSRYVPEERNPSPWTGVSIEEGNAGIGA